MVKKSMSDCSLQTWHLTAVGLSQGHWKLDQKSRHSLLSVLCQISVIGASLIYFILAFSSPPSSPPPFLKKKNMVFLINFRMMECSLIMSPSSVFLV